jgi:lipopolysaccharide heptosyltransferase I
MDQPDHRFLVIRLSSIGDIVHALPAVAALGEAIPRAEIHWVIETRHAALVEGNPFVHRVVKLDTLGWRQQFKFAETAEDVVRGIVALREVSFDAAIDFQGLYKSGLIAWLSRSRERVGFAERWLREPATGVLYTERVAPRGCRHIIEMNLALVERLGVRPPGPERWQFPLPRTDSDDRYVDRQLASLGVSEFIVINAGGGWKSKCWAPENYAELIRRFEAECSWPVLMTGSAQEEGMIRGILERAASRRARYLPSTLVQLIALARRAKLFVGGDTGPVHLAAAVGTPLVALYGAADPVNTAERNGPFRAADIVVCGPGTMNHHRGAKNLDYLRGVSVDSTLAAVRERLARAHG